MSYTIRIRNNATGEVRQSKPYEFEWSLFWWTDGNMGCDCNRHLAWLRAGGPGPADDPFHNNAARQCGDGAYTVIDATLDDATVVPVDSPE